MTNRTKLMERDLGAPLKSWLTADGFEFWDEVKLTFNNKIPDVIAARQDFWRVIELKTSLSFEVIAQAQAHLDYAHECWVAVPEFKDLTEIEPSPIRKLGYQLCRTLGIGVVTVRLLDKLEQERSNRGEDLTAGRVTVIHEAVQQYHGDCDLLREAVSPENKVHAQAGTKGGGRWNKTTKAYEQVRSYLDAHSGAAPLEDVLRVTRASRRLVLDALSEGKIERVQFDGTQTDIMLRTVEPGDEAPLYSGKTVRRRA